MVQHKQFFDSPTDDPNLHMSIFVKFYDTLKMNNVYSVLIWLIIFLCYLQDKAKVWLHILPSNSIMT